MADEDDQLLALCMGEEQPTSSAATIVPFDPSAPCDPLNADENAGGLTLVTRVH